MSSNAQIDIKEIITNQAMMAQKASQKLATLSSLEKNKALLLSKYILDATCFRSKNSNYFRRK